MSEEFFTINEAVDYIKNLDKRYLKDLRHYIVYHLKKLMQFEDEENLGFDDNQMVTEPGFVKVCSNNVEYLPITSNDDKNTLTSQKSQNESIPSDN